MQHSPTFTYRNHRIGGLIAVLALAAVALVVPESAASNPITKSPQLSISVDNGHKTIRSGDRTDYTVTITNLGSAKLDDLVVTQSVPAGSTFISADRDGTPGKQAVTWTVNLKAMKRVVLHASMKVAKTPDNLHRLATVACAQATLKEPPVVCASDSDLLPAGAAADTAAADADTATRPSSPSNLRWWFGPTGLAVVGVTGAGLLLRRRRRNSTL